MYKAIRGGTAIVVKATRSSFKLLAYVYINNAKIYK